MSQRRADWHGSPGPNDEVMPYSDDETDDELDETSDESEAEEPRDAPRPPEEPRPPGGFSVRPFLGNKSFLDVFVTFCLSVCQKLAGK